MPFHSQLLTGRCDVHTGACSEQGRARALCCSADFSGLEVSFIFGIRRSHLCGSRAALIQGRNLSETSQNLSENAPE